MTQDKLDFRTSLETLEMADAWQHVIDRLPEAEERLEKGQQFNTYSLTDGGYAISLGPATDALHLTIVDDASVALLIETSLRAAAGRRGLRQSDPLDASPHPTRRR